MEETRMPLGVALGHEEPPRDPSFEYRWPFQLGKPLIRPELVIKLSPKMYKFHERYMQQSLKGVHSNPHPVVGLVCLLMSMMVAVVMT
jgi:hypothetical protein